MQQSTKTHTQSLTKKNNIWFVYVQFFYVRFVYVWSVLELVEGQSSLLSCVFVAKMFVLSPQARLQGTLTKSLSCLWLRLNQTRLTTDVAYEELVKWAGPISDPLQI